MLLHAAHENGFEQVTEIPISLSLIVIVSTITLTVIISLIQAKRHPELVSKLGAKD
jgi:hypothetical protein